MSVISMLLKSICAKFVVVIVILDNFQCILSIFPEIIPISVFVNTHSTKRFDYPYTQAIQFPSSSCLYLALP